MPRFLVRGVMTATGQRMKVLVEASTAESAQRKAAAKGVTVDTVTPHENGTEISHASGSFAAVPAVIKPPPPLPAALNPPPVPTVAVQPPPMPPAFSPPTSAPTPWVEFVGAGQDASVVAKMYRNVLGVLTAHETLSVLVVQKKPLMNVSPDCIAATDRRVIYYQAKMLGRMSMYDFIWSKLADVRLNEGFMGATISFNVIGSATVSIDHLPKEQARAFYRFAQEREEAMALHRRQLDLEQMRAQAGGVTVQNLTQPMMNAAPVAQPPAASGDPVARLQSLQSLLTAGLIGQGEFDAKKAEILKSI